MDYDEALFNNLCNAYLQAYSRTGCSTDGFLHYVRNEGARLYPELAAFVQNADYQLIDDFEKYCDEVTNYCSVNELILA